MLQKPQIRAGLMGHFARRQTLLLGWTRRVTGLAAAYGIFFPPPPPVFHRRLVEKVKIVNESQFSVRWFQLSKNIMELRDAKKCGIISRGRVVRKLDNFFPLNHD